MDNQSQLPTKPPYQSQRKRYTKPSIEKINLVPNETVLGSCVQTSGDPFALGQGLLTGTDVKGF